MNTPSHSCLALSNPRRKKILIKTRTPAYLHPLILSSTYIHVCTNKQACMLHNQTQTHPSCGKLMPSTDASARHHPDTSPVNLRVAHTHTWQIHHVAALYLLCVQVADTRKRASMPGSLLSSVSFTP